jgi:hypothetical protein
MFTHFNGALGTNCLGSKQTVFCWTQFAWLIKSGGNTTRYTHASVVCHSTACSSPFTWGKEILLTACRIDTRNS